LTCSDYLFRPIRPIGGVIRTTFQARQPRFVAHGLRNMGVGQGTGAPTSFGRRSFDRSTRTYRGRITMHSKFPDGTFVLLTDPAGTRSLGAR
jgi:hypothetical protein